MFPHLGLLLLLYASNVGGQHLQLSLHRHQGCAWKSDSSWHRKMIFEGGSKGHGAQLVPGAHKGCYSITGKVEILEDILEELLIYLSVSTTGDTQEPPEQCRDANPQTGCGGIGSCLYCRPCESLDSLGKILGAQLVVNGRVAGCEPLKKGVYDNVELRFCLPDVQRLLEWQGISEKALDHIVQASNPEGKGPPKLSLFVTVYVFDKNVRPLLASQRKLEGRLRELRAMGGEDQLDSVTYWNLPFNQMIKKKQVFIACHKLFGSVQVIDEQQGLGPLS